MSVEIRDNTMEFKKAMNGAVPRALEKIGLQAEGYAKMLCPTDTGLLKNSITHAVSGQAPAQSSYHASKGSNRIKSGKNAGKRYSAGSMKAGSVGFGTYSGTIGSPDEDAVYIGTNVEYAPYVELGTQRTTAKPFLKPAVENHVNEYKKIVEDELRNA